MDEQPAHKNPPEYDEEKCSVILPKDVFNRTDKNRFHRIYPWQNDDSNTDVTCENKREDERLPNKSSKELKAELAELKKSYVC